MSEEKPTYNMDAPTLTPDGNGLLPRRNGYRGMLALDVAREVLENRIHGCFGQGVLHIRGARGLLPGRAGLRDRRSEDTHRLGPHLPAGVEGGGTVN